MNEPGAHLLTECCTACLVNRKNCVCSSIVSHRDNSLLDSFRML